MKKHKSLYRALGALLALTLLLTLGACGGGDTPTEADPAGAEPETAASEDGGDMGNGGESEQVLRVARDFEGSSLDPAVHTTANDYMFAPNVFETLVCYDFDYEIQPLLAESWDVSEDGLTYTFQLRRGVQFHHGYGELTASDIKFSYERLADPELGATYNYTNLGSENMTAIEAPDDYTLVIELEAQDPNLLIKLASHHGNIVSEKAVEDMGLEKFSLLPVGTGAFQAVEGAVMGERCEVERFDDYWGEKAKLDRITFQLISEPGTMFNAFESGEVDLIQITDYDKLDQYRSQPERYTIAENTSRSMLYVGNNMSLYPFDDPLVREAMVYAIDRDSLINDYYKGFPNPATSIVPEPVKFALTGYWDPVHDPDRARELLADAGYPDGFSTEFYCPNDQISMGAATVIQNQLAQVGIDAQLQTVDFGVFLDKVRGGEAPIWLLYNDTNIVPDNTLSRYTSEYYPGSNWCGIVDEDYDRAVAEALAETDESLREEKYHEVQRMLIDFNAIYTVNDSAGYNILQNKVKGLDFRPDLALRLELVYIEE